MLSRWVSKTARLHPGSRHISPQSRRSSRIRFHSSDSVLIQSSCANYRQNDPKPHLCTAGSPSNKWAHRNRTTPVCLSTNHLVMVLYLVWSCVGTTAGSVTWYITRSGESITDCGEHVERRDEQGDCTVLDGLQIWDAIFGDKGKALGTVVWRRGNQGRFP